MPGIAGTWKFLPPSRSYSSTTVDQPNQNYDAILIGDISGNWTAASGTQAQGSLEQTTIASANSILVDMPNSFGPTGSLVTIPIRVENDLTGQGVISYDLDLAFDGNVLQPQATATNSAGTLSSVMTITANSNIPGHLKVSTFGTAPLSGAGTLLNMNFRVVGAPGASTQLTPGFKFNEGNPQTQTINGQFSVSSPTSNPRRC